MQIKVGKFYLDDEQTKIVLDESKYTLVVAGAGSGKTMTILGKLKFLIETKKVDPKDILCISFTAKASEDLKQKILKDVGLKIDVYTFHKLGLEVLKRHRYYEIADSNLLNDIIREYFEVDMMKDKEALKVVLKYFDLKKTSDYKHLLEEKDKLSSLEALLSTFIHLFKANNHKLEDFLRFLDSAKRTLNIKKYRREKLILKMAVAIYTKYENYLKDNEEVDFDDMLIEAKKVVDKKGFIHNVKYIIVDEYQDTSLVRFELLKSIVDNTGASLMAVGDDFQSIYRFTGCDITLFLKFNKTFKDGKLMKIQNTYRNSQELIYVAGQFIMKNKSQVRKKLRSSKSLPKPIVIKYYKANNELSDLIYSIYEKYGGNIMILGRNNKDITYYLNEKEFKLKGDRIISFKYPELNAVYLTAHRSKGLECDNVIIINLKDSLTGFPNQIEDDKILRFVSKTASKYPFDEERRLFYVAMTRTKNRVFLFAPKAKTSIFVNEIIKDYKKYIEIID